MTLRQATVRNFKRRNEKKTVSIHGTIWYAVCARERSNNMARTAKTTGFDCVDASEETASRVRMPNETIKLITCTEIIPFAVLHGLRASCCRPQCATFHVFIFFGRKGFSGSRIAEHIETTEWSNAKEAKTQIECPFGMEMIPEN